MIAPWMLLAALVFTTHMFLIGFVAGKYYVKNVADLYADSHRPQWLQDAVDAYREDPNRPLDPDEVERMDWQGDRDKQSND